jgi:hypothetical protein
MPHVREVARDEFGIAGRSPGHPAMIVGKTDGLKRG